MPEDVRKKTIEDFKASRKRAKKEDLLKLLGEKSRKKIQKGLPALGKLIDAVKEKARSGWLRGLDGRLLEVRSQHSALNTLLQSAGAIIMKRWLVQLDADLQAEGFVPFEFKHADQQGHYEFVANVHDEAQTEVVDECVKRYDELAVQAFNKAGEFYDFRCRIDGEGKCGSNWAVTH